jgi:hypothetical protein
MLREGDVIQLSSGEILAMGWDGRKTPPPVEPAYSERPRSIEGDMHELDDPIATADKARETVILNLTEADEYECINAESLKHGNFGTVDKRRFREFDAKPKKNYRQLVRGEKKPSGRAMAKAVGAIFGEN